MANPCNIVENKDFTSVTGYCFPGLKAFERNAEALARLRRQIGTAMIKSPAEGPPVDLVDALKKKSAELNDIYEKARDDCNNAKYYAGCGYVYAHENYLRMFGPAGELREKSGVSTEIKFKAHINDFYIVDIAPETAGREVILDTGAPVSLFSPSYYDEAKDGFSILDPGKHLPAYAYSGEAFEIGALKFKPEFALVNGIIDQLEGSDRQHRLIALFGTDFLLRQPVEINRDRSVVVVNQDVRERLKDGVWSATSIFLFSPTVTPGYKIGIVTLINGAQVPMLLDTGASKTSLGEQCKEKFPKEREGSGIFGIDAGGDTLLQKIPSVSFSIGGKEVLLSGVPLDPVGSYASNNLAQAGACGLLGNDVLSNFNFIIDPVTMMLYSTPVSSRPEHRPDLPLGIRWSRQGSNWVIDGIADGGMAQKAGIKVGDKLIKVDGQEVALLSFLQMIEFSPKHSDRLEVEFEREGKRSTVVFDLAENGKNETPKPQKPPELMKTPTGCNAHLGAIP